jgi:hypothetical protein
MFDAPPQSKPERRCVQLLLDPWFVVTGCLAVTLLGLSKGGFIGLGTIGLPLLSLFVPPMQAAAILLPTLLAQDVLTIWTYRRDWSRSNLAVLIPSMGVGIAIAYFLRRPSHRPKSDSRSGLSLSFSCCVTGWGRWSNG